MVNMLSKFELLTPAPLFLLLGVLERPCNQFFFYALADKLLVVCLPRRPALISWKYHRWLLQCELTHMQTLVRLVYLEQSILCPN